MEKKSQEFSMQEILRMANSPAGRQLVSMLQQTDHETLRSAMNSANAGNYDQATQQLKSLMDSPQVQTLLKQMRK